jgi:hypothetical protein
MHFAISCDSGKDRGRIGRPAYVSYSVAKVEVKQTLRRFVVPYLIGAETRY